MPLFSIIVPVYNVEHYLRNCLDSILKQRTKDYEVLLIDDGATDGSGAICEEYAELHPSVFRVFHYENGGVSAARNRGLMLAKGEYVVFVDADDILDERYLSFFCTAFSEHKQIDMAICGVMVNGKNIVYTGKHDYDGLFGKKELIESLVERTGIRGFLFNKAFKRSVLVKNAILFQEDIHMCEDLLFCLEYAKHVKYAWFSNLPYYDYVQRSDSAANSKFNPKRISVLESYKKVLALLADEGSPKAIKRAEENYLMHNVNIFLMVYKKKEYYKEVIRTARYIKYSTKLTRNCELSNKERMKVIYARFCSRNVVKIDNTLNK